MGELKAGTMVNANVRLTELLAEGGMGSVWRADHLSLQTEVAVKVISPAIAGREPTLQQRFKREAAVSAQLRSTHVVQVFDHGETDDGVPFIVMELLEGQSLTQRIEGDGPMTLREAGMVVAQVAKVLHRAHVLGIVHRDIKPDNLFLTESDYEIFVKVLDFGIAKQTRLTNKEDSVTKTGMVVGTVEFMSPEQAVNSKHIDFEADLWSLGVVAYYALTGALPFDSESGEPMWLQMTQGKIIRATAHRPDLPKALDGWFKEALQAKPADRFKSAKVMADSLASIIDEPVSETIDRLTESLTDDDSTVDRSDLPLDEHEEDTVKVRINHLSEQWGKGTLLMNDDDHRHAEDDLEDFEPTCQHLVPGGVPSSPHSDSGDAVPLSGSFDPLPGEGFAGPPVSQGPASLADGGFSPSESGGPLSTDGGGHVTAGGSQPKALSTVVLIAVLLVLGAVVWGLFVH
jgi:serine/threonine protein kinase